jgi:hypothetical protein
MNELTEVELQTCGARKTEQESKLSAFFAKMEEFFASPPPSLSKLLGTTRLLLFFLAEGAYAKQGRARIRRLRPDGAARPALMSRAAHAVESKAVVLIEVAASSNAIECQTGRATKCNRMTDSWS